jgi:hypothetical protein
MVESSSSKTVSTKLERIAKLAKQMPGVARREADAERDVDPGLGPGPLPVDGLLRSIPAGGLASEGHHEQGERAPTSQRGPRRNRSRPGSCAALSSLR